MRMTLRSEELEWLPLLSPSGALDSLTAVLAVEGLSKYLIEVHIISPIEDSL